MGRIHKENTRIRFAIFNESDQRVQKGETHVLLMRVPHLSEYSLCLSLQSRQHTHSAHPACAGMLYMCNFCKRHKKHALFGKIVFRGVAR